MRPWEPEKLPKMKGRREERRKPKGELGDYLKVRDKKRKRKRARWGKKWLGAVSHQSRAESFTKEEVVNCVKRSQGVASSKAGEDHWWSLRERFQLAGCRLL